MNLQPDPNSAGTWVNPAWVPGTPGLFALIIGVSEYTYLDPLSEFSPGMGSLPVSALTAFRLFQWLDANYHYEGVPLATCRLLVSPTAEELALAPEMAEHGLEPVFANCEAAVGEWFAQMETLPVPVAEKSRSVFFFSGHGLEITEEMQVLLPKDYLDPRRRSYDRAIGTSNLRRGLKALKVPLHFLFLDACRNDHDNLRQQEPIEGYRILNPVTGAQRNPRCFVPLFFATAAGRQAFQPPHPSKGISLFGRALLEGLGGRNGIFLECDGGNCKVKLDPLMTLCKTRIPQIAKDEFGEVIEQEVRIQGDYTTEAVTQIPGIRAGGLMSVATGRGAFQAEQLGPDLTPPPDFRPLDSSAHAIFGHETVTFPMIDARVFADRRWLEKPGDFVVTNVRVGAGGANEIELAPRTRKTAWLELVSLSGSEKFGIVLPNDGRRGLKLRHFLELDVDGGTIARMAASLSWRNSEPYRMAASIWRSYRDESLGEAVYQMAQSPRELEAVLAEKVESPLSASIAAMLLVRGREWGRLHDWPRNLAEWFPDFSDGAVLWAELLLQRDATVQARQQALHYLLKLRDRRLPVLSPVLAMAYQRLQEFADDEELSTADREQVRILLRRLSGPIRFLRPGSLYTVFAGTPDSIRPEMVMPVSVSGVSGDSTLG